MLQERTDQRIDRQVQDAYFALQADFGLTKHIGGQAATDRLVELCAIGSGSLVLEGGCGTGVTACYLARELGATVVGVDRYEAMVARSVERAERDGLSDQASFRVADLVELPFEDNAFDVAICESVIAFVEDRPRALGELVRVVRPGGAVGFTEATWKPEAPVEARAYMSGVSGAMLMEYNEWELLLREAGLQDITAELYPVKMRQEAIDQFRRTRASEIAAAFGRFGGNLLTSRRYWSFIRDALKMPNINKVMDHIAYGIYTGHKPA